MLCVCVFMCASLGRKANNYLVLFLCLPTCTANYLFRQLPNVYSWVYCFGSISPLNPWPIQCPGIRQGLKRSERDRKYSERWCLALSFSAECHAGEVGFRLQRAMPLRDGLPSAGKAYPCRLSIHFHSRKYLPLKKWITVSPCHQAASAECCHRELALCYQTQIPDF